MPKDAVATLKTRLANQRLLTLTAVEGGEYAASMRGTGARNDGAALVALEKPGVVKDNLMLKELFTLGISFQLNLFLLGIHCKLFGV